MTADLYVETYGRGKAPAVRRTHFVRESYVQLATVHQIVGQRQLVPTRALQRGDREDEGAHVRTIAGMLWYRGVLSSSTTLRCLGIHEERARTLR